MQLPFFKNESFDGLIENSFVYNDYKDSPHGNAEDIDYDKTGDTFGEVQYSDEDSIKFKSFFCL